MHKRISILVGAAFQLIRGIKAQVPSQYTLDPSLPSHTIYHPTDLSSASRMPIIVWGNGGCSANPSFHGPFLLEVAAWGHIVIASGTPGGSGSTTGALMQEAIDWASSTTNETWAGVIDTTRIAAAGMSCGGLEAYEQATDERVTAIGIFSSGEFTQETTDETMSTVKVPVFFFLGGETDIAYANGMRDYAAVTPGLPTWVGNYPSGHGGTYLEERGGVFGTAAQHYFRWVLRGDESAADYFEGGGAEADGWTTDSKDLDALVTTPLE
ncbi:hypothetical protein F4778DRAFT_802944 [Xylariomycetidae sp. FL2044]|nr:hypothetical protein F4778DRAFT_802944 [Xylariomycetidae sp. FL2044]